ncbi:uncharacterized protein LOC141649373 [Silene latifolia]|uniref:uncharacterized protein LOC141649373 n=1 Tax=Silene latifolia TaxID=37657 RepID=UPI003D782A72
MMKNGYVANTWILNPKGHTVSIGYEWLRHKQPQQHWTPMIWSSWNIPKHAIITWISMHKGLNVKEKLFRLGCCTDDRCIIYDREVETQSHLFFDCPYSNQVLQLLEQWCGFSIHVSMLGGLQTAKNCLKQQAHYLLWNALYYHIWNQRNAARIHSVLLRPQKLAGMIKDEVCRRIKVKMGKSPSRNDSIWLRKWGL